MAEIDYKYNEAELLNQLKAYIDNTYDEHYAQNKYQATEFIIDGGHGTGFTLGNILKYAQRYGHKGSPADWRKDLMKVLHYSIIALYVHDMKYNDDQAMMDDSENNDLMNQILDKLSKQTKLHRQGSLMTPPTKISYSDL